MPLLPCPPATSNPATAPAAHPVPGDAPATIPADVLDAADPAPGGLLVCDLGHDTGARPWALCDADGAVLGLYGSCYAAHSAAADRAGLVDDGPADDDARPDPVCTVDYSADFGLSDLPTADDVTAYRAGLLYTPGEWDELVERAALDAHFADLADLGLVGC